MMRLARQRNNRPGIYLFNKINFVLNLIADGILSNIHKSQYLKKQCTFYYYLCFICKKSRFEQLYFTI